MSMAAGRPSRRPRSSPMRPAGRSTPPCSSAISRGAICRMPDLPTETRMRLSRPLFGAACSMALLPGLAVAADPALDRAVADPQRSAEFRDRDTSRHPAAELEFFGIKPNDTVVEIWPSGGYWTEILGPYLHDRGKLYEAGQPADTGKDGIDKARAVFQGKLDADPARYGGVTVTQFGKDHYDIAPAGSADLIVTFRNLHNWLAGGYAEPAMAAFYKALKPGGILGIEDHRAAETAPQD